MDDDDPVTNVLCVIAVLLGLAWASFAIVGSMPDCTIQPPHYAVICFKED